MHEQASSVLPDDASRTAFTLTTVYRRQDANRITSTAVDSKLHRLFLGLSNGSVEEHQLLVTPGGVTSKYASTASATDGPVSVAALRLISGRKLYRQGAVTDLCCLPGPKRVVARGEDGTIMVCPFEGADVYPVNSLKNSVAIASDGLSRNPARLAVACKSGALTTSPGSKVYICLVGGGAGPVGTTTAGHQLQTLVSINMQENVLGLAWAGDSVVVALPGVYKLIANGGAVTDIAPHSCPIPILSTITSQRAALILLAETMTVVVSSTGGAVSPPLFLSSCPVAATCLGAQVVVVTEEGIEAWDKTSGQQLQAIPFVHDDAYIQAAGKMPFCVDWALSNMLFATSRALFCLAPVSPEAQARELLKKRKYAAFLDLVLAQVAAHSSSQRSSSSRPPSSPGIAGAAPGNATREQVLPNAPEWCLTGISQAALLLLQECQFLPALTLLLHLPPSVWQPCQLAALFPAFTQCLGPSAATQQQDHIWGLHGSLTDLMRHVHDYVELQQATSGLAGRPGRHLQYSHSGSSTPRTAVGSDQGGVISSSAARALHEGVQADILEVEASLIQRAEVLIAAYLLEVRGRPGVEHTCTIDTLLMQLLIKCSQVGQLEAWCCQEGVAVPLATAKEILSSSHRWHALALFMATHGGAEEALQIWHNLATSSRMEALPVARPASDSLTSQLGLHVFDQISDLACVMSVLSGGAATPAAAAQVVDLSHIKDAYEKACSLESASSNFASATAAPMSGLTLPVTGTHTGVDEIISALEAANGDQAKMSVAAMVATMSATTQDQQHADVLPTATAVRNVARRTASPFSAVHQQQVQSPDQSYATVSSPTGVAILPSRVMSPVPHGAREMKAESLPQRHSVLHEIMVQASTWSDAQCTVVQLPVVALPKDAVPVRSVLKYLPWLLDTYPGDALHVLCSRSDVPLTDVLQLLHSRTDDVRWRYLHHVLYSIGSTSTGQTNHTMMKHNNGNNRHGLNRPAEILLAAPASPHAMANTKGQPQRGLSNAAARLQSGSSPGQPRSSEELLARFGIDDALPLHTELALEIVECVSRHVPTAAQGLGPTDNESSTSQGLQIQGINLQGQDSTNLSSQPHTIHESTVMSPHRQHSQHDHYYHSPRYHITCRTDWLKAVLHHHLSTSQHIDANIVLQAIHGMSRDVLLTEEVLLYSQLGDHVSALQILVLQLGDVDAGIAYCKQRQHEWVQDAERQPASGAQHAVHGRQLDEQIERLWLMLLDLCLRPGEGRQPLYSAALKVLAAPTALYEGGRNAPHLDPLKVLAALPDDMPLPMAVSTLSSMIISTGHKKRNAQVLKALHRVQNLELRAQVMEASSQRIIITETSSCNKCSRPLANRVFVRSPSTGNILCERCTQLLIE